MSADSVHDAARLAELRATGLLDSPADPAFDRFTRLAARLLDAPVALVSLVDVDRQFFKSHVGLSEELADKRQTPLTHSYCRHTVASGHTLAIRDARLHPLVAHNPAVAEYDAIAYLGAPLRTAEGHVLGTLCVVDNRPRAWSAEQAETLEALAASVSTEIRLLRDLAERRAAEVALGRKNELLELLHAVAADANQAGTLQAAVAACLRRVCAHTGWPVGHAYFMEGDGLVSSGLWHGADGFAAFRAATELTRFAAGEGLPGRVLETGRPAWRTDVAADPEFTRAHAAAECGLHGAFAFPVEVRGQVKAVLEFFCGEAGEPEGAVLDVMRHVGTQMGRVAERTLAQEGLRQNEERTRRIVESAHDAFVAIDAEGLVVDWNAQAERTFGWRRDEVYEQPLVDLIIPPAERERHLRAMEELLRTGEGPGLNGRVEVQVMHRGGTVFPVEMTLSPVQVGGSRIFTAFLHDISERKQAQQEVQRKEEYFRALIEKASDLITILNVEGTFIYESPAVYQLFGYEGEELRGRNAFELIHPDDVGAVLATFGVILAEAGTTAAVDFRFLHKDGSWRWLGARGTNLLGHPAVGGVVVNSRDITASRAAEEASRRLASIVESSDDAIVSKSLDGTILSWNSGAERIYGYTAEEVVGLPIDLLVPPEAAGDEARILELIRRGERIRHYETVRLRRDGRRIHVSMTVSLIRDAEGNVTSASSISRNITERKRAEAELVRAKETAEAANVAKSEFLSRMSHELRTPLNSVIGFTNVLKKNKRGALGEQELGFLDRIASNGMHLLGLINDILDLAKVEAGKAEVELSTVALDETARTILTELQGAVRDRPVELRTVIPASLAPLEADAVKLKQVLINLVGNAIKFTERGSVTLAVTADAEGRPVRIDVADTGVGIPRDRLAAIFLPFEQAELGTTRRYGGTGLGLAISSSLCDLMGYRLQVRSEEGKGSVFSIILAPHEASAGEAPAPQAALAPPAPVASRVEDGADFGGRLVLVIDDEADSRLLLTHHAEEFGCRTVTAASGEEGLRMARELRPDLITLDLLMPGMNGWNTLRELRADPELRHIPVVVVSVVAGESRRYLEDADELVDKPVGRGALLSALRRSLARAVSRALVVDADEAVRNAAAELLREDGVEVRTAPHAADALRLLDGFAPDLVLLDIPISVPDGRELIHALHDRTRRAGGAPPVVVAALDRHEEEAELAA
jgi:PAS domain S-box-containing protein